MVGRSLLTVNTIGKEPGMKDPIEQRFRRNLERVQVLLALYQSAEELRSEREIGQNVGPFL